MSKIHVSIMNANLLFLVKFFLRKAKILFVEFFMKIEEIFLFNLFVTLN